MQKLILFIAIVVVIAGVAFYGGMQYAGNKAMFDFRGMQKLSSEELQQGFQQMGGAGGFRMRQDGANAINGEIIAKDDKSATVKLRDGGTKIIFFSESTEISKFDKGNLADLEIGKTVMASGKANEGGSITAQTIQVRLKVEEK